jgi:NADH:ubiquinone oxidoreductase subunit 6 (subunit J)
MPDGLFPVLILVGVLVTAGVLFAGVLMMARGGSEDNPERSNKLMQARVWAQGITILIAMMFLWSTTGD